ncbi:MAG: hypothetical protein IJT21_09690 [Synergistaceae bacterium]|nr:hypothetical protein [Synergistaceae bacterium]
MPHNREKEQERYEDELSLFDIINILWRRKFFIIIVTMLFGIVAVIRALLAPFTYKADCKIIPQQTASRIEGLAASLGGLADFMGMSSRGSGGALLLGILRSDSVADAIIDRFNLMGEASADSRIEMRKAVLGGLQASEVFGSGIITISYIALDPQKAADIANAFVDELQNKLHDMSVASAQKKREFFEGQLIQAQKELNDAEDAMINYQQRSGVVVLDSQTSALINAINDLRKQVAAKNVEVSSLKSYARKDNPQLKLAQSQLDAMRRELQSLEEQQKISDSTRRSSNLLSSDVLSMRRVPELGREYNRYARALQFATAKYELMLRQYESAKLTEANDMASISVIDYAYPPDARFGPQRTRMVIINSTIGLAISVFWSFFAEYMRKKKEERERAYNDDYDDDDDD